MKIDAVVGQFSVIVFLKGIVDGFEWACMRVVLLCLGGNNSTLM